MVIYDNYYSQEEIENRYGILKSNYHFEYAYESDTLNFIDVFPENSPDGIDLINYNNPVVMSVASDYEITYQLNDSSGNLSEQLTRYVRVTDTREPVVKRYGAETVYVDLQSIEDGDSRYTDLGAYAVENLYIAGSGLFDWTTTDNNLKWSVRFEQCDDLENDTYSDLIEIEKDDNYIDYIASLIDTYF